MGVESPEPARELSVSAAHVESNLAEISHDVWEHLLIEIPQVRGEAAVERILLASVKENVATLLHIFENDIPLENLEGLAAANEHARRLAQRDIPVSALIRAYRLGHWRFLQWCLDELSLRGADDVVSAATNRRMLKVSFGYIDRITEHVTDVYYRERERWLMGRTAMRAARVRDILAGKEVDLDATEAALGYRLRRHHLGLVAWMPTPTPGGAGAGLTRLDRLTHEMAEELGCPTGPLFVPRDEGLAWAWLPFGCHSEPSWDRLSGLVESGEPSVQVCAGSVQRGIGGFRSTNREALRAQELATAASPGRRLTAYAQVAPIALMCDNLPDLRTWVGRVLGPLAVDDEQCALLRETLRDFLATGCNYTATASNETLHKNTVHYRIRKAEEIMGALDPSRTYRPCDRPARRQVPRRLGHAAARRRNGGTTARWKSSASPLRASGSRTLASSTAHPGRPPRSAGPAPLHTGTWCASAAPHRAGVPAPGPHGTAAESRRWLCRREAALAHLWGSVADLGVVAV
ncbi:PucR family transcriptional regulator [Streptomyces sp. NPDC058457]|uniref:PucR family transcriptional regulator n=1 Tax=Streptomyces sp. NPDC058457 TaxID=3346507 RepID=UPI00364A2967